MENINSVVQHTENLFISSDYMIKNFKKDTYAGYFDEFRNKNSLFFNALKDCLSSLEAENKEQIFRLISENMIQCNKAKLNTVEKKERFQCRMNQNMYMAVYVLPAIRTLPFASAKELSEYIAKEWGQSFKDSDIIASDYERIENGFHRKLCYITTAVCNSLNKGEDCEELLLIKKFRDQNLPEMENGRKLIAEYYDIAPTLVKKIEKEKDSRSVYRYLYDSYISNCVSLIQKKKYEDCKDVYVAMIDDLCKKYLEG